ncbi:lactate utilization protein [Hominifimenecus sp. rT4P-3]|uniref:lactate utilization protein n=1 Tax=Hominifimenecus sp. rT4P-3 TaxID=3242979 RepID=UPI003DA557CC
MQECRKVRNRLLGAKVADALKARNMDAWYVETKEEALEKALSIIPDGSSVSWGGSMSVQEIGLIGALKAKGTMEIYDRDAAATPEERQKAMRQAFFCDYFLASSNAVSEDGILVNIDGYANRVAAIAFGPEHVLMVVGINKVVKTEADALSRARSIAATSNAQRFEINTPCKKTGACANCKIPDTICCQFLTTRYSKAAGRIQVILVGEDLGL